MVIKFLPDGFPLKNHVFQYFLYISLFKTVKCLFFLLFMLGLGVNIVQNTNTKLDTVVILRTKPISHNQRFRRSEKFPELALISLIKP